MGHMHNLHKALRLNLLVEREFPLLTSENKERSAITIENRVYAKYYWMNFDCKGIEVFFTLVKIYTLSLLLGDTV